MLGRADERLVTVCFFISPIDVDHLLQGNLVAKLSCKCFFHEHCIG